MFSVTKKFQIEYAHRLIHLPEGHKCRNLHGHSGVVTIEGFARHVRDDGFVIDFGEFAPVKNWLNDMFDHAVIVDDRDIELKELCEKLGTRHTVIKAGMTSSEVLAQIVHDFVKKNFMRFIGVKVTWSETQNNFATYESESLR